MFPFPFPQVIHVHVGRYTCICMSTNCPPVLVSVGFDVLQGSESTEDTGMVVEVFQNCLPHIQIVGITGGLGREGEERGRERGRGRVKKGKRGRRESEEERGRRKKKWREGVKKGRG